MSTYEKVVIVGLRFISVLWLFISVFNFGLMGIAWRTLDSGLFVSISIFILVPLVIFFAAPPLAKIITAGID